MKNFQPEESGEESGREVNFQRPDEPFFLSDYSQDSAQSPPPGLPVLSAFVPGLRCLRAALGIGVVALASLADCSREYIRKLENEKRKCSPVLQERFAKILFCDPIDLQTPWYKLAEKHWEKKKTEVRKRFLVAQAEEIILELRA